MSERKRAREWTERQAVDLMRGRILSGLHGGHLHAGDRLATYRDLALETGLDLRAVTRVYEALAGEGLVEVRGRAGVFVAPHERLGGRVLEETARWMVGVLRESWLRQMELPRFPDFARECIATSPVRCAFIESTVDQLETICNELRRDFGFFTTPVDAGQLGAGFEGGEETRAVREADLLVTTAFHAARVRPLAERLDKPLMVVRLHPDIVRELQRLAAAGELTVVYVDPRFAERVRLVVGGDDASRIRFVAAEDREAVRRLGSSGAVVVSHAARARVGDIGVATAVPGGRVLSTESAEELIELLVRFNLQAISTGSARPGETGRTTPRG
ncbi:MAG: GntR family transcriptional regulator [Gemmatimonadetes bacterium]|nr:GntR family transcriptional regulator [Gemmatimonadota bacterium]